MTNYFQTYTYHFKVRKLANSLTILVISYGPVEFSSTNHYNYITFLHFIMTI